MVRMVEVVCPYCHALLELPPPAEGGPGEGASIICNACNEAFMLGGGIPGPPGAYGDFSDGSVGDVMASVGGLMNRIWFRVTTTMWAFVLALAIGTLLSIVFFMGWMVGDDVFGLIGWHKR